MQECNESLLRSKELAASVANSNEQEESGAFSEFVKYYNPTSKNLVAKLAQAKIDLGTQETARGRFWDCLLEDAISHPPANYLLDAMLAVGADPTPHVPFILASRNLCVVKSVTGWLLPRGKRDALNAVSEHVGAALLLIAAQRNMAEAAAVLLDAGADVNIRTGPAPRGDASGWTRGMTPLMAAAAMASPQLLQLLLDRGADATLTTTDPPGRTALHDAMSNSHPDTVLIVNALIAAGADIEASYFPLVGMPAMSPLGFGCAEGLNPSATMRLLELGASASVYKHPMLEGKATLLHACARGNCADIVNRALSPPATPTTTATRIDPAAVHDLDDSGQTALMEAARCASYDVAIILLKHFADPAAVHDLAYQRHCEAVLPRLGSGSGGGGDGPRPFQGGSPLAMACACNLHVKLARALIDTGGTPVDQLDDQVYNTMSECYLGSIVRLAKERAGMRVAVSMQHHASLPQGFDAERRAAIAIVLMLLEAGGRVLPRESSIGKSQLDHAAGAQHTGLLKAVLASAEENGSLDHFLNLTSGGESVLHAAASGLGPAGYQCTDVSPTAEAIDLLFQYKDRISEATLLAVSSETGDNVLHAAARSFTIPGLRRLLELLPAGVKRTLANQVNKDGNAVGRMLVKSVERSLQTRVAHPKLREWTPHLRWCLAELAKFMPPPSTASV